MPEYSWSGRDAASGKGVTGTLRAGSQQEAIATLKRHRIVDLDVFETRSAEDEMTGRRRFSQKFWGFLFFASACLAGAAIFSFMTPLNVIRCSPDRSCSIERRIAGVYVLWTDERRGVVNVTIEHTTSSNESMGRRTSAQEYLSLDGMSTDPMLTPIPSCAHVRRELQEYLDAPKGRSFIAGQAELASLLPLILILAALQFVRLAFRSTR
jgi:hypothetical protein